MLIRNQSCNNMYVYIYILYYIVIYEYMIHTWYVHICIHCTPAASINSKFKTLVGSKASTYGAVTAGVLAKCFFATWNPKSEEPKCETLWTHWNILKQCFFEKPQQLQSYRYVWNVLWKSLKNWTAVTCGKLQKKQCLDDFLLTPVTRWTLPSKLLNSNSFAATRRVKHLQPLCRNLWDAGQLMWLDGLKSCTPSTTMSQYVIYSLTLKIRRNCRNWIIRHDPFPLQLVPVCASTTIFIGLESQPSRGFPRHVPTSGPFPFRSRISLRLSSNKGRFLYIAWRAGTSDRKTCSYSAHVSPKGIRTSNWLWLSVASTSGWTMLEALLRIPQEFVFVHSNVSTDAFTLYRRLAGHVGEVIKEVCVIKILIWHAHFLKSPEAFAGPAGFGSPR